VRKEREFEKAMRAAMSEDTSAEAQAPAKPAPVKA